MAVDPLRLVKTGQNRHGFQQPAKCCAFQVPDRFIPAGAGNTFCDCRRSRNTAVHPRRRGEHPLYVIALPRITGSSPQARGTLFFAGRPRCGRRFIPAGAGNTGAGDGAARRDTVHPRRRGEHTLYIYIDTCARFIPAGAGNTHLTAEQPTTETVHPRRRGEHGSDRLCTDWRSGSSPQARGTPDRARL